MNALRTAALLLIGVLCHGCATSVTHPGPSRATRPAAWVYLVSHGWHTGIIMQHADVPPGTWPEAADFPDAEYLEVGWGDWDYYQAQDVGVWVALKAALWPTASVLNVVGFSGSIAGRYPHSEIVELGLSRGGLGRLSRFIHDSFDRHGHVRVTPLGAAPFGNSRFYPAVGKFHLFNTCNVWAARALQSAGYPITPSLAITATNLMSKARTLGREIRYQPLPHGGHLDRLERQAGTSNLAEE